MKDHVSYNFWLFMWANNTSQFVTFAGKENNISPGNKNVSEFAIVKLLQSNLMRSEKIKIYLEGKMTEREVIYPLKNPLHQPHVSSLKPTSWFPKSYYPKTWCAVCSWKIWGNWTSGVKWSANEEVTSLCHGLIHHAIQYHLQSINRLMWRSKW